LDVVFERPQYLKTAAVFYGFEKTAVLLLMIVEIENNTACK
jgi:hypothetical protein